MSYKCELTEVRGAMAIVDRAAVGRVDAGVEVGGDAIVEGSSVDLAVV